MRPCPSTSHVTTRLRTLALTSPPATALFYAQLWHAIAGPHSDEHESLHVLALCLIQVGQVYPALGYVRNTAEGSSHEAVLYGARRQPPCPSCAMILARCCMLLGRYTEGKAVMERALKRSSAIQLPTPSPATTSATAFLTLASLSHKGKASEQAVEAYARALNEDPWLWEAFTGLCDIGAPPTVDSLFPNPPASRSSTQTSRPPISPNPNPMPRSSASEIPGIPTRRHLNGVTNGSSGGGFFTPEIGGANGVSKMGMLGGHPPWDTPSGMADSTFATIDEIPRIAAPRRPLPNLISSMLPSFRSNSGATSTPVNSDLPVSRPPAVKRPRGGGHSRKPAESSLPLPPRHLGRDLKSIEPNGEENGPVRRSTRLKSTGPAPKPSRKPPSDKRSTRSRSATSMSSASGATIEISSPPSSEAHLQSATDDWLRDLIRRIARAYRSLSIYACQDAIDEISQFPSEIRLPFTLEIAARAYYEMANYTESQKLFEALRIMEPYSLRSMEHYSTLLWHLGDAPRLSQLAQRLVAIEKESPQPWIAAGNCFSLKKNHDEAMRCFRRATQVDPGCAYAWTLCGYEAIEMEEYDRAIAFYRTAIRTDTRHYNAWYGMGLAYLKTGKPKYAEHHFRRAAEINPTSPVLLCCIGMVLEEDDDIIEALSFYEQACKYAPESSMAAYKRIRILVAIDRIEEAISLLEPLSRSAPDEANIQFLLGKCYLKVGRRINATVCFTSARELQPKLENAIRAAMGGGGEDDEDEEL